MESALSPYHDIDDAIQRWIERHGLSLCREWEGEARFWYTSRGSECFQISVDHPVVEVVTVHAWSIETDDGAELHGEWTVSLPYLEQALATATRLIGLWAERFRLPPQAGQRSLGHGPRPTPAQAEHDGETSQTRR
jgi:hypothetical protein